MNQPSPAKNPRSLKNTLRTILAKCRRQTADVSLNTIGSGILRREPSLLGPPHHSVVSFFTDIEPPPLEGPHAHEEPPDLGHNENDDDFHEHIPNHFDIASLATSVSFSHHTASFTDVSLRPQLSFRRRNEFDSLPPSNKTLLLSPPTRTIEPPRKPHFEQTINPDAAIASHHASVVTLPTLRPSASTLRIQSSTQSLRSALSSHHAARPLHAPQSRGLLRKSSSISASTLNSARLGTNSSTIHEPPVVLEPIPSPTRHEKTQDRGGNSFVRFTHGLSPSRSPSAHSDVSNSLVAVDHFASFCALDTGTPGCPVTATSKDLRYIFDLGEQFCLNNQAVDGASIDMITGWDVEGNPITHLVLFSPLIAPQSGRSRFMLASLVDVTDFINDSVALIPELEAISEESSFEEEISTPTLKSPRSPIPRPLFQDHAGNDPHYALSADDLLGGCFVAEPKTPIHQDVDDVWLNIATEERSRTNSRAPSSYNSSVSSIDDVLDDFMNQLQELYSDFFLLAKSPLDDNFYEISNVSPRVYTSKDYVHGHLSRTSAHVMTELSHRLAFDDPFTLLVRWGTEGQLKQMYSIPLFARSSTTWVCFLVDPSMPPLW